MRRLANLFLILFLLTAGLNLCAGLLPGSQLVGVRQLAGLLMYLLSVPVYTGLGLHRRLDKRTFAPLLLFLGWGLLDFWPLEPLAGSHYRLYAAAGQLLLGVLTLQAIRRRNGQSLLLSRGQFAGAGFSAEHLLRFGLVSLLLLPVVLLLLGYAAARGLIETQSAGFVRLKPDGLYMVEKDYVREAKTIRLAGMIHLGQSRYYQELSDSFNAGDTLLLAEGVTDRQGLLTSNFSYGGVADLLGLSTQQQFRFPGRLIVAEALELPGAPASDAPDILPADLDLQDFDPFTIAALNAVSRSLQNGSSREFNQWAEQNLSPESIRILINDLVHKRNQAVLSYLPQGLQKYRTLLIPWGAMHMPGIEAAVKQRGFVLQETRERQSIDFFRLPYARLWRPDAGAEGG
jgi:hypothetical protein